MSGWTSSALKAQVGPAQLFVDVLSFTIVDGESRAGVEVWCSKSAPGMGVAGMGVRFGRDHVRKFLLAGYGTRDERGAITKTWGSTLGELAAELAGELEKSPK